MDAGRAPAPDGRKPNYWEYIRVEELLALQSGLERDEAKLTNDEVLFVTVHQVFELWFKLVLRELHSVRDLFKLERVEEQDLARAVRGVRRVITILESAVKHFDVVETLTTREYLGFRNKLMPASGFQSAQLRQIEIVLGLSDGERVPLGSGEDYLEALRAHDGSESVAMRRVLAERADRPSLLGAVEGWLYRTPIDGVGPSGAQARAVLDRFIDAYVAASGREIDETLRFALARAHGREERARLEARYAQEQAAIRTFLTPPEAEGGARRRRIRAATLFILSYRELPLLAWPREVLDGLVELEQRLIVFRQRHARMVERVIGRRIGTGGSSGVDYLDQTALAYRVFKDLWAARTYQIRRVANPPLENARFYGFLNA
jgi:tryptophan 2,3-dioxygenase